MEKSTLNVNAAPGPDIVSLEYPTVYAIKNRKLALVIPAFW
jgi:hypothetical protein